VRRRHPLVRLVITGLGVGVFGILVSATPAQADGPMIEVTPASTSPGDSVLVELNGWPGTVATAQVCGNGARRGSTDCDQVGAESIRVPASGREFVRVRVQEPPVGCPCVIRVSTVRGDVVRTAPITVDGVPDGVDLAPVEVSPAAASVRIRATVVGAGGVLGKVGRAFGVGGRSLVLTVHDGSAVAATGLRFVGTVGRPGGSGTPLSRVVPDVAPGATVTTRIPLSSPFPPWADLEVRGVVAGFDVPVPVRTSTTSDPWAAELAVPLVLLGLARVARRSARRAEPESSVGGTTPGGVVAAPATPQVATECSPGVGVVDDPHWESVPYHPESAPGPGADPVPVRHPEFV